MTFAQRYNELPHIDSTQPLSVQDDGECLLAVSRLLHENDAQDRLHLTLLHQHFRVEDDEVLVSRTVQDDRRVDVFPTTSTAIGQYASQSSWQFVEGTDAIPLMWSVDPDSHEDPLISDPAFAREAKRILAEHGSAMRFGFAVPFKIPLMQGEYLLETTFDTREQEFSVQSDAESEYATHIETSWRLPLPSVIEAAISIGNGPLVAASSCQTKCYSNKYTAHFPKHKRK